MGDRKLHKIFQKIALKVQAIFNRFDFKSFGPPLSFSQTNNFPIFIIGAPRSGSTLLYQLLVKHTKTAYISNLMALIPSYMITIARLTRFFCNYKHLKESQFGYISGMLSPSEAGAIQKKWFESFRSTGDTIKIRNIVIQLTRYVPGPFISKNLMNSKRLDQIISVFPEARFIYIRRDPLFNAQSLLLSRLKIYGSEHNWWSIRPEGYEKMINKSPKYQVVWQILKIEELIARFINDFSPESLFTTTYEKVCRDTKKEIKQISEKFQLQMRKDCGFKRLSERKEITLSKKEWAELEKYYQELRQVKTDL